MCLQTGPKHPTLIQDAPFLVWGAVGFRFVLGLLGNIGTHFGKLNQLLNLAHCFPTSRTASATAHKAGVVAVALVSRVIVIS